ncbi:MAG: hypothetical protein JWR38_1657 [Mucilaginibacter sp.]|nr:hypothetical protein [Mucilaginibacter sp.]
MKNLKANIIHQTIKNTMKHTLLLAFLLMSFLSSFAQSASTKSELASLAGYKVTSTIENKTVGSTPIAVDGSQTAVSTQPTGYSPSKTEKLTWETVFENKTEATITATKKLKRIIFILDRPFGILKYDSDNSFESSDGSERLVKKFTDQLGVPSTRTINGKDNVDEKASAVTSKTDILWNNNLPIYDASFYWNGLNITLPPHLKPEQNASWKTKIELNDKTVENEFVITKADLANLVIAIKSKEVYKGATTSLNAEGAPSGISLGLNTKQKTFDGTITVDAKTMFILSGTLKTETISDLSINGGGPSERKSYSITTITTSIKR